MKRTVALVAGIALAAVVGSAAAKPAGTLVIRHQVRGCHTWSYNGDAFAASQSIEVKRGGAIVVVNNDVMPHRLVKLSGGAVTMRNGTTMPHSMGNHRPAAPGAMNHMGATTTVTFAKPGTYTFTTKAGEDYMQGMKTIGEDNILKLRVTVS